MKLSDVSRARSQRSPYYSYEARAVPYSNIDLTKVKYGVESGVPIL